MVPASSSSSSPAPVRGSRSERFSGSSRRAARMLSATGRRACRDRNSPPATARTRKTTAPPGDQPVERGERRLRLRQRDPQFERQAAGSRAGGEHAISPAPRRQARSSRGIPGGTDRRRADGPAAVRGGDRDPPRLADDDDQPLRLVGRDLAADLRLEIRRVPRVMVRDARQQLRRLPLEERVVPRLEDTRGARDGPTRIPPRATRPGPGSTRASASSAGPAAYSSRRT